MTRKERKEIYIDKITTRLNNCSLELLMRIYDIITYNM